jgi:asparagine synthase (glutamine-hydrolysing)
VIKLPAAHYLIIDVNSIRIKEIKKYWFIQDTINSQINENEAKEHFRNLFVSSVKMRLRSDVPIGSSLSGGLDSSLVVMIIDQLRARNHKQLQKTFSARFPGFKKDEGSFIDLVIGKCLVEPHFTYPTEQAMLDAIDKIVYHQEEPFGSASICAQYLVYKLARENNVVVLMDGQGADEILAGYHFYYSVYFNELRHLNRKDYKYQWQTYKSLQKQNDVNQLLVRDWKYYANLYADDLVKMLRVIKSKYNRFASPELNRDFYDTYSPYRYFYDTQFYSLNECLKASTTHMGLEELLRYADRNSMAHSIEVRLPFLSHELVEFLFTLPAHFKIRNGWTKWLMRAAFDKLLPNAIAWRKDKIGYEPPQQQWMHNTAVQQLIFEKRRLLVRQGILNKKVLEQPVHAEAAGTKKNNSWAHWMVGNLYE